MEAPPGADGPRRCGIRLRIREACLRARSGQASARPVGSFGPKAPQSPWLERWRQSPGQITWGGLAHVAFKAQATVWVPNCSACPRPASRFLVVLLAARTSLTLREPTNAAGKSRAGGHPGKVEPSQPKVRQVAALSRRSTAARPPTLPMRCMSRRCAGKSSMPRASANRASLWAFSGAVIFSQWARGESVLGRRPLPCAAMLVAHVR
jgi:hypothetical protein